MIYISKYSKSLIVITAAFILFGISSFSIDHFYNTTADISSTVFTPRPSVESSSPVTLDDSILSGGFYDFGNTYKSNWNFVTKLKEKYSNVSLEVNLIDPPYSRFDKGEQPAPKNAEGRIIAFSKDFGAYHLEALRGSNDDDFMFEIRTYLNNKLIGNIKSGDPEKYSDDDFVHLYQISFGKNQYYLFEGWSGGAYCCTTFYPVLYDGNSLKLGKKLQLGADSLYEMATGDAKDTFFIKNGKLYVTAADTRFINYLGMCHACSTGMYFPVVYRFDGPNFAPAMQEFSEFYKELYGEGNQFIEKLKANSGIIKLVSDYKKNYKPAEGYVVGQDMTDYILVPLDRRFIIGLFAGYSMDNLVKDYRKDYGYFFEATGPGKDDSHLQEDILDALRGNGYENYLFNGNVLGLIK